MKADERKTCFKSDLFAFCLGHHPPIKSSAVLHFVLWPFPKACYSSHKRLPTFLLFINDFKNDVIESIPAAGEIKACLGKAW